MLDWNEQADQAAHAVRRLTPLVPRIGLILGSGLGEIAKGVVVESTIGTTTIPHFPRSTVAGHAGTLILGWLAERPVAILAGRVHGYEGYSPAQVGFAARLLGALGCRTLVVTNAAGGLNPAFRPGDVMLIEDHISFPSLAGFSPLIGGTLGDLPRFVDLTGAYSTGLRRLAEDAARRSGVPLHAGLYVMVAGPNFETPAEVRFLRSIGGDAVGMSTVPEVIVARQLGMDVLGISVISNMAAGLPGALLRHNDVLTTVALAVPSVRGIIEGVLKEMRE